MESLYFLKFWRFTIQKHNNPTNQNPYSTTDIDFNEDQEDSFFELELTNTDWNQSDSETPQQSTTTTVSLLPSDAFSKRKILPIEEPTSKTHHSSISILKSSPKFKVLMFKRSKSMSSQKTEQTEHSGLYSHTQKLKRHENKLSTLKFNEINNGGSKNASSFTKENSLRRLITEHSVSDCNSNSTSKRFSKEVIQKYLKRFNPLYIKKENSKNKFLSRELSFATPSSSPATLAANSPKKGNTPAAGVRRKHLVKSKSATAMAMATQLGSPTIANRRDDSLLMQHDGIQSAILHCKRSFNSSADCSIISRFASEPMYDKTIALPRFSCEETGRVYNESRFCSIS